MTTTLSDADRLRIHTHACHVFNHLGASNDHGILANHAAYLVPHLGVHDGKVVLLNDDGTPRMLADDLSGSGVPVPYPIERFVTEQLLRDEPRARWKPYP